MSFVNETKRKVAGSRNWNVLALAHFKDREGNRFFPNILSRSHLPREEGVWFEGVDFDGSGT